MNTDNFIDEKYSEVPEYDLNKETGRWAFPGKTWGLIGNSEMEVPTMGMTKREYYALHFSCAIIAEWVKQPTPALMEIVAASGVRMADELIKKLDS